MHDRCVRTAARALVPRTPRVCRFPPFPALAYARSAEALPRALNAAGADVVVPESKNPSNEKSGRALVPTPHMLNFGFPRSRPVRVKWLTVVLAYAMSPHRHGSRKLKCAPFST